MPTVLIAITSYDITRDVLIVSDPTLLVLASLADGEKHGYAMMEDIQRFAGVRLGPGTLYGAITRLEERGWIRPLRIRRPPPSLRHHRGRQAVPGRATGGPGSGGEDRHAEASPHEDSRAVGDAALPRGVARAVCREFEALWKTSGRAAATVGHTARSIAHEYADDKFELLEDRSGMHAGHRAGGRNLVLHASGSVRFHRRHAHQPANRPDGRGLGHRPEVERHCVTFRHYSRPILSRSSLSSLIAAQNLYVKERSQYPLEDIVLEMRDRGPADPPGPFGGHLDLRRGVRQREPGGGSGNRQRHRGLADRSEHAGVDAGRQGWRKYGSTRPRIVPLPAGQSESPQGNRQRAWNGSRSSAWSAELRSWSIRRKERWSSPAHRRLRRRRHGTRITVAFLIPDEYRIHRRGAKRRPEHSAVHRRASAQRDRWQRSSARRDYSLRNSPAAA